VIEADEAERTVIGRTGMGGGVLDLRSGKSSIIPSSAFSARAIRGDNNSISANEYLSTSVGSAGLLPLVVNVDRVGRRS